ncbi:MAG TPA: hypothetical protein VHN59_07895 [Chitinophagaceae bacterium]|nr:hypothetical protein [Chitinophagaceae bacterium]
MPISGSIKHRQLYRCRYILLHILLPILTGLAFYLFIRKEDSLFEGWVSWSTTINLELPSILTGVLPDFLWCYSLLSFQQLVWGSWKGVPALLKWLIYVFVPFTELLQYWHLLQGTGDMLDVLAYLFAFIIHYKTNKPLEYENN